MIKVYNRSTKEYETEDVVGKKYLNWCYESPVGKKFTELFVKKKLFSKVYGGFCNTKRSVKRIEPFIKQYNIDMNSSLKKADEFSSFNDFFARQLTNGARPISKDKNILISPGDGRLLAYTNINMDNLVQVKDLTYSLAELIGNDDIKNKFDGGTCLIFRLCPTDYHRFHFIDSGIPGKNNIIPGRYYSVNPVALERIPKLYCQNKREWSVFKSDNFGDVIHVEVGATCVGTIVQTYTPNKRVNKGDEKGYFKFGGSTTILFLQKDSVKIDDDILNQSKLGYECKVILGEKIGTKI